MLAPAPRRGVRTVAERLRKPRGPGRPAALPHRPRRLADAGGRPRHHGAGMSPLSAAFSLVSLVLAFGAPAPRHPQGLCLVTEDQRAVMADEAAVAASLSSGLGR